MAVKRRKEMVAEERRRKQRNSSALETHLKEINESLDSISTKHGYDMVMVLEDIQSELKSYRAELKSYCEQDQIHIDMP